MIPQLTKYPIIPHLSGYVLQDRAGHRISFHRTISGALRKRHSLLELERERWEIAQQGARMLSLTENFPLSQHRDADQWKAFLS
jgi:hypothetical protein